MSNGTTKLNELPKHVCHKNIKRILGKNYTNYGPLGSSKDISVQSAGNITIVGVFHIQE